MTLYPLDAVRNASIDRNIELLLEDVREAVARFPFSSPEGIEVEDVLHVYDLSRPRLNVLLSSLIDMAGRTGIDVGTGFGFLPVLLKRYGTRTIATDRDRTYCDFALAHDVEVLTHQLGRDLFPFAPESVDFVVLAEVLEHLKLSPIRVLREVSGPLRAGGRFLLTTPNIARMQHLEALAAGENFLEPFDESLPSTVDPTDRIEHVREYSVREVVDAVEGAGLAIESVVMTGWGASGYDPMSNPFVNEIVVVRAIK